jgi:hypothetical protein
VRTSLRLRIPSIVANAPVATGAPVPAIDHRVVTVDDVERPSLVVGHWNWNGRRGAFLRLEDVAPGDEVQLGARSWVAERTVRGVAPVACGGDLVLRTPQHLRWPPWVRSWDLPASVDPERQHLEVAVGCRAIGSAA